MPLVNPGLISRYIGLWLLVSAVTIPAFASEEEENLSRLRAMSRDERGRLVKKLDEFDSLDRPEREAIRAFDAQISALPRNERARHLAVLRRYYVFYQGLSPDQQKALDAEANPDRKLEKIAKFRQERKPGPEGPGPYSDAIQVSLLAPLRLNALAHQLIVYFDFDPKSDAKLRAEFARMKSPAERADFAKTSVNARKIRNRGKFVEEEAEFQEADHIVKNEPESQKEIKKLLHDQADKVAIELDRMAKVAERLKRKTAPAPTSEDAAWSLVKRRRSDIQKTEEIKLFKVVEGQTVSPENLQRFDAALPPWARESIDPLPPDAGRRRLRVLYRLVFPPGHEIPVQVAEPEPMKPTSKRGVPAPEGNSNPF